MAETAGLVLGVAALASLFTDCIELAERVKLANNLGPDYEILYTKFLLLEARLMACGEQMRSLPHCHMDHQSSSLAQRSLVTIKHFLDNAESLKDKYGLTQEPADGSTTCQARTLQEVEACLRISATQRQRKLHPIKKIFWAVRDKKAFDNLISDLAFHIKELEALLVRVSGSKIPQIAPAVPQNISLQATQLLEAATAQSDMNVSRMGEGGLQVESLSSECHLYLRNQIKERARVLQGNIGNVDRNLRYHAYWENEISGNAKVIQGNATSEALRDFWKD
jgi:Prion-inhibition and propagation